MSHYQYTLAFDLADNCPASVVDFFGQLTAGPPPEALPEADESTLQTSPLEVLALLADARLEDRRVMVDGCVEATAFYMPFMALCEWLARWSATPGLVGYYRLLSELHPTLLYFAAGKPYMLQVSGLPIGIADGSKMPADQQFDDE